MSTIAATAQLEEPAGGRRPRLAVLWVIGVSSCGAAVGAFVLTYQLHESEPSVVHAALVGWITLAYVLCGLIAWRRRPESWFGPLLLAAGFGPLLSSLRAVDGGVLHAVGRISWVLPVALFLHVFLAFPSGRLGRRSERIVVVAAYCFGAGFGALAVVAPNSAGDVVLGIQRFGLATVALVALGILLSRHRGFLRGRRSPGALVALFALALVMMTTGVIARALGSPATTQIRWVTFGLLGLAPVFLVGSFMRSHLARTAVGDLVLRLQLDPTPAEVRDALAVVLRDPSLTLAYWLPDFDAYADLEGRELDLESAATDRMVTPIDRNGAHVAALVHDPALQDDQKLLGAVTAAAGIALENAQLHVELRARLEELRGSRARIIEAGRSERQRLERNLHDGAQQRLIALSLELSLLEERVGDDPETRRRLDLARREVASSLEELRELARGLHPAVVSNHGLEVALESLAALAPVPVRLNVETGGRLPVSLEVAAYYLVAETFANIGKYADASSASVHVSQEDGLVVIEVVDDGVGGADTERGSGLRGLADRVETLDGRLRIWSPAGGGTRVRAEIPCEP
jgi:signal transduction histidine kinase